MTQECREKAFAMERGRNRTDKIYIRHCFGFIDINIYIRIWRVLRMCVDTCFHFRFHIFFDLSFSIRLAFCAVPHHLQNDERLPMNHICVSQKSAIIKILLQS